MIRSVHVVRQTIKTHEMEWENESGPLREPSVPIDQLLGD